MRLRRKAFWLALVALASIALLGDRSVRAQRLAGAAERVRKVADKPLEHLKSLRTRGRQKLDNLRAQRGRGAPVRKRLHPRLEIPKGLDRTSKFQTLYRRVQRGRRVLPREANDHVYLLVGGIYTAAYPRYMRQTKAQLEARGLDVHRASVNTFGLRAENVERLTAQIRELSADGRQVVLIGHSKGGVDIASALALHPELAKSVRAAITIQSPYAGFGDVKPRERLIGALTRTSEAVREVSNEGRRTFNEAHPYPTNVTTLSIASTAGSIGMIAPAAVYHGEERLNTDGWVPTASQYIPGTHGVQLANLNHGSSVWNLPAKSDYKSGPLIEAAVALALRLPRRASLSRGRAR